VAELPESHLDAWRATYESMWRAIGAIETDLAAAGLPSLSWYDALYQLYRAPERRLRMSELAQGALMSRSGLTRLVDRLVKEGLIIRRTCPSDRRGQHAELTKKGIDELRRIWPVYRDGIAQYFAAEFTEAEARKIAGLMGRLVRPDAAGKG